MPGRATNGISFIDMTTLTSPLSRTVNRPRPVAKRSWKLRSFVVCRRDDPRVRPYRSVIYSPLEESADLGVGLSADEVARRVGPSFLDGLGASRAITAEELADLWENLGITVKGGGSEATALSRAARMAVTARMRGVIGAVRLRLKQGRTLHVALAEFPDVFAAAHCALAEAATELPADERAQLYLSLAGTVRDAASRARRFFSTMLDQLITAGMLAALVLVTLMYFVPNFAAMFRGLELELPWAYECAAAAGNWLSAHAWFALPALAFLLLALVKAGQALLRTEPAQRALARAPGVGSLVRNLALSRSLPLFAVLHRAGVHPETCFRLAGDASGNVAVRDFFRSAYARCAAGADMEKAFLAERLALGREEGRRLAGKIEAGGELGDLEGVLRGLASEFSERANARIEALPKLIKPLNLAVMGAVVGVMAALVGLPSMLVLEKTFKQQNMQAETAVRLPAP